MNQWPTKHKNLAAVILAMMVAVLAVYVFFIRPNARDLALNREVNKEIRDRLVRSGWPVDSERLAHLLDTMRKTLDGPPGSSRDELRAAVGIRPRSELMLRDATAMFAPKIREYFGSNQAFVSDVSRLDYQEEFVQLERRLRSNGVILAEPVLGIGENTSSPYTYRLVLQVWTLDALVKLALDHQLQLAKVANVEVNTEIGPRQASRLSVLPVRAYFLNREDAEPYVLELPVRMTLRGRLPDVRQFLRALHADGRFFPISHMELRTDSPNSSRADSEGNMRVERVEVEVECSAFFRPREDAPLQREQVVKPLPRGA